MLWKKEYTVIKVKQKSIIMHNKMKITMSTNDKKNKNEN